MKHLIFTSLVLVLGGALEVNAQGDSSKKPGTNVCDRYKIGILAPSKDIDFKIGIIVPPNNLDQAMVFNLCPEQNQVVAAVQIIGPRKQPKEFFKVPPFTFQSKNSEK